MHEAMVFHGIENNAYGVKQSASKKEHKTVEGDQMQQRLDCDYDRPAHKKVKHQGYFGPSDYVDGIHGDSDRGERKVDRKESPAQSSAKQGKANRRIASYDQNKDGAMVKFLKHLFCIAFLK